MRAKVYVLVVGLLTLALVGMRLSPRVLFEDDFAGRLAPGWRWLREDAGNWRFRDNAVEIRVEPGVAETVKNALVRSAPDRAKGTYAVEVTITNLNPPTKQYEQAGITWYHDGKPVFKLVKELIDGKLYVIPGKVPMDAQTVQLRLIVTADGFTAQFRPGGRGELQTAATGKLPPPGKDEVSIQCYNGPDDAEHWIRFDDFRIVELEPTVAMEPAARPTGPAADSQRDPVTRDDKSALPLDWRRTPIGPDGGLQYDPRGPHQYATRVVPGVAGGITDTVRQVSGLPDTPFVVTVNRRYQLECVTEVFAVPAPAEPRPTRAVVERTGSDTVLIAWATPRQPCDPTFAHIAVGWNEPITYRFRVERTARYAVVFGLCEGHHWRGGQRPLDLRIEGASRRTVDPLGEQGRNVPAAYAFDAADENGDGWIEATVAAVPGAPDTNTILNALWVFPSGACPPAGEIITGKHNGAALVHVACGEGPPPAARDDVLILRLGAPQGLDIVSVPTLTLETALALEPEPDRRQVHIGTRTSVVCPEPFVRIDRTPGRVVLVFRERRVPAGGQSALLFGVHRGSGEFSGPLSLEAAEALRPKPR